MSSPAFKGNLIATNLPSDMTGDQLASLFDGFGMVIGAEIRVIPAAAGTATIGVVALAPESAVERAIEAVNLSMIGERRIKVGRARERPQKPKARAASDRLKPAIHVLPDFAPAVQATQQARTVIVEYKPRRRLTRTA
jgi:RNA recognition motif-containing protein